MTFTLVRSPVQKIPAEKLTKMQQFINAVFSGLSIRVKNWLVGDVPLKGEFSSFSPLARQQMPAMRISKEMPHISYLYHEIRNDYNAIQSGCILTSFVFLCNVIQ